jgi:hypothetical protein
MLAFMSSLAFIADPDTLTNVMPRKGSAARELRQPWRRQERPEATDRSARATFYLPPDLLSHVRDAVVALSGPPAQLTMSKFAENAFRRELDHLEKQRSGAQRGMPFEARKGQVRRGRPLA